MPFNFELTISGLCVIVLKSQDDKPTTPTAVEILCVAAYGHRPRLNYPPLWVYPTGRVEPELCVDPTGQRIASLDIRNTTLHLDFGNNPATEFTLDWGNTGATTPPAEEWMHWVPSVQDLGLTGIRLSDPHMHDQLVRGVSARLSLPPGTIFARNIVLDIDDEYAVWNFPAVGIERALANEIVYRAEGVEHLQITWEDRKLEYERYADLKMCLSNDMEYVPSAYSDEYTELHHLSHLEVLADPLLNVQVPTLVQFQHTGHPICNQVFFVDKRI